MSRWRKACDLSRAGGPAAVWARLDGTVLARTGLRRTVGSMTDSAATDGAPTADAETGPAGAVPSQPFDAAAAAEGCVAEGCLVAGTSVSLPDGSRRLVEQLAAGDTVAGLPGSTVVSAVTRRTLDTGLVTVVPVSAGNTVAVTAEHLVATARSVTDPDVVWMPAGELQPGALLRFQPPRFTPSPVRLSEGLCRLTGFFAAVGRLVEVDRMPGLRFTFGPDSEFHVETVRALLTGLYHASPEVSSTQPGSTVVSASCVAGHVFMRDHAGRSPAAVSLSPVLLGQPPKSLMRLVDAFVAAAGHHVYVQGLKTAVHTETASFEWALQLQQILLTQGLFASVLPGYAGQSRFRVRWPATDRTVVHAASGAALVPVAEVGTSGFVGEGFHVETGDGSFMVNGMLLRPSAIDVR